MLKLAFEMMNCMYLRAGRLIVLCKNINSLDETSFK
jgi:hypothetical protein